MKTKLPSIVPVLVLTLITVIMWVGLDVYRAFNKPAPVTIPDAVSQPLTPTLDVKTINQIESRTFLNDSQIPEDIISNPSPSPAPRATPVSTAQPVNASGSGTTP